jgi:hypothetical protein
MKFCDSLVTLYELEDSIPSGRTLPTSTRVPVAGKPPTSPSSLAGGGVMSEGPNRRKMGADRLFHLKRVKE